MLDDNGADIFGLQLAYKLMEKYLSGRLEERIERLNVTQEQLFFYSFANQFCSGSLSKVFIEEEGDYDPHSVNNVRVNAVAQHPGFRKAFNCPDNSRMMKSATEQCIIYGENAPETRKRKKFQDNLRK